MDSRNKAAVYGLPRGMREHLSHADQDLLTDALQGLPSALNNKLLVGLGSGEFEDAQSLVDWMAEGLSVKQMGHLRRAIDELPRSVRDNIDI